MTELQQIEEILKEADSYSCRNEVIDAVNRVKLKLVEKQKSSIVRLYEMAFIYQVSLLENKKNNDGGFKKKI